MITQNVVARSRSHNMGGVNAVTAFSFCRMIFSAAILVIERIEGPESMQGINDSRPEWDELKL
jgi:hypothetical protein